MRNIKIVYPDLPPPEFSRNSRAHWAVLNKVQDDVLQHVHSLLLEAGWRRSKHQPWEQARVSITYVLPDHRRRDADNLITATVPLLNSLKGRVFKDDCLACIGIPDYNYRVEKGVRQTVVEVEGIKGLEED